MSLTEVFGGMPPPLINELTEKYIELSSEVFEAKFSSSEKYYYHGKRLMTADELSDYQELQKADDKNIFYWSDRNVKFVEKEAPKSDDPFFLADSTIRDYPKYSSLGKNGRKFQTTGILVRLVIKLKITKVINGDLTAGDIKTFEYIESPYSACPHYLELGQIKKHQRYFVLKKYDLETNSIYRYQTIKK